MSGNEFACSLGSSSAKIAWVWTQKTRWKTLANNARRYSSRCVRVFRVGNVKSIPIPESDTCCKVYISPINSCVHFFLDGQTGLLKVFLSLNHSFKNTDSSSNETSQSWVSHWIIPFINSMRFSRLILYLQNWERTTTSIFQNRAALFCTQTALNRVQFLCSRLIFVHSIQQQINVLWKETQNEYVWYLNVCLFFLTTLELKLGIDKNWKIKFKRHPTLFSSKRKQHIHELLNYGDVTWIILPMSLLCFWVLIVSGPLLSMEGLSALRIH